MELIAIPRRLDAASIAALRARVSAPPATGVLALSGHSDGLDLDALVAADAGPEAAPLEAFAALLAAMHHDPRPALCLLDGPARGGGVGLVAAADLVIAHPGATFALPEVFYGLVPATVLPWLIRRVGPAVARRMALGGAPMDAAEALRVGLVDAIDDDPPAAAGRWAERWGRADPRALATVGALTGVGADIEGAIGACRALLASDETRRRLRRAAEGHAPWLDGPARGEGERP